MPFPAMASEVDTAPRSLKFKITSRGIRTDSKDKPQGNTSKGPVKNAQKINRISGSGNNLSQLTVHPSMPATLGKRKLEGSFAAQIEKKMEIDGTLKYQCGNILKKLLSHPKSYIFSEPVDPVRWNIPDYFSIINEPMDLGTIKRKLDNNMYFSVEEFADDVKLTFSNATTYNPPGNHVHELAKELYGCFSRRWTSLCTCLKQRNCNDENGSFLHSVENNVRVTKKTIKNNQQGAKCIGLSTRRFDCASDDKGLWNLRTEFSAADSPCGNVKPARIALKMCSSFRTVKKEPCSRRSSAPSKQSQSVDSAQAKCSSCASLPCHCRLKDGSTQASKSDISSERPSEINRFGDSKPGPDIMYLHRSSSNLESNWTGVVIHEDKSSDLPNPAATALSSTESWASLNIQLSPNKALRAAMLKRRFADTIFRATHPVEKVDPVRMQQEREKLESAKREEKARIAAEIIAAEAAAQREEDELKMKRGRERDAARLALQMMQKSVDINEGSGILKDVEMLCFGFQADKTLERLGLYLKVDYLGDEEDDDDSSVNAEEGEIV